MGKTEKKKIKDLLGMEGTLLCRLEVCKIDACRVDKLILYICTHTTPQLCCSQVITLQVTIIVVVLCTVCLMCMF